LARPSRQLKRERAEQSHAAKAQQQDPTEPKRDPPPGASWPFRNFNSSKMTAKSFSGLVGFAERNLTLGIFGERRFRAHLACY
jgi:hypothetical protein